MSKGGRLACVAVLTVAFEIGLVVLDGTAVQWWSDVGLGLAAGLAAVALGWRATRATGAMRRTWAWTAAAATSWAVGQCLWTADQILTHDAAPFPSAADAFYVATFPLAAVAALSHLRGGWAARSRAILDGLIGGMSSVVAAWSIVLATAPDVLHNSVLTNVVAILHPVLEVALAAWFGLAALRADGNDARTMGALALVWAALGLTGFGYGWLVAQDRYFTGHLLDGAWFASFAALAAIGVRPPAGRIARTPSRGRLAVLLPYAPLGIAAAVAATGRVHPDSVLTGLAFALAAFVVVRQNATLLENNALARHLEERVITRTAELARSEARYRNALAGAGVGSFEVDLDTGRVFWSLETQAIHGIEPGTFGGSLEEAQASWHPDDLARIRAAIAEVNASGEVHYEHRIIRPDGHVRWIEGRASLRTDGGRRTMTGVLNDITERKQADAELDRMATTDALTELPNRSRLLATLDAAFADGEPIALLMMDLDGFKDVNDGLGHDTGDLLLVEVAARLRSGVRAGDLVARLGGDEFAIALVGAQAAAAAPRIAEELLGSLNRPIEVAGLRLPIGASVGIALAPEHAGSPADLLRHADVAMYRAKQRGSAWVVFDGAIDERRSGRLAMLADLRAAIDEGAIDVHYQPQVDLRTGRIVAVEALARWRHPVRGVVSPAEFIPLAEHSGLIRDLTPLVLREALAECHRWRSEGFDLLVAVNMSARLLEDPDLAAWIDRALLGARVPPSALTIEITEGAFADDTPEVERTLVALRQLGVRLSVDDFGTGYSGLAYLRRFPVDDVKIDRSFIAGLPGHAETGIVRAVLELGRHLGVTVVAEGVEDPATLERLCAWGCDVAQGHLLARPQPASDLMALLAERENGAVGHDPASGVITDGV